MSTTVTGAKRKSDLNISGNIVVGGTVDGVDIASFKSSYDSHTHTWGDITGKPSTFTPSSHGHAWSEITGKPSTFTPSSHTHNASDINAGTLNIARIPTGTTSTTVALGNHTHSGYASTSHNHDGTYAKELRNSGSDITQRLPESGFYEHNAVATDVGYPEANWMHLLNVQHSNTANNYAMQLMGDFYEQKFWIRNTANNGATAWNTLWTSANFDPSTKSDSGHNHDSSYVKKSGDTMTGDLTISQLGNSKFTIIADSDNVGESDNPMVEMTQDGGQTRIEMGLNSSNKFFINPYHSNTTPDDDVYIHGNLIFHEGHLPTWSEISGKPTTFTPSSHTHAWTEITGKPSTFTPSSHTHSISDVTNLQSELDDRSEWTGEYSGLCNAGWVTIANFTGARGYAEFYVWDTESGDHSFIHISAIRSYASSSATVWNTGGHSRRITGVRFIETSSDTTYGNKKLQIYVTASSTYRMRVKNKGKLSGYTTVTPLNPILENTPTGYQVQGEIDANTLTHEWGGLGSTGKIVAGTDMYVGTSRVFHEGHKPTWSEIDSKPTTFTPSSHTHNWADIVDPPTYDNYNGWDLLVNGTGTNRVTSGEDVNFVAGSNVTITQSGTTITISSTDTNTDTNTWRPIDDVPVNGATTTSISSNWAYDITQTINGKASSSHTHSLNDLSDVSTIPQAGSILEFNGTSWVDTTNSPNWNNVTGKPTTFTPSSHSHSASDITSGTLNIARIPTGTTSTTVSLGNHSHSWSAITGKPTTFAPSSHTHAWSDITGGPDFAVQGETYHYVSSADDYAKFRVYGTSTSYAIGMKSAQSFGYLNDWAMTFTMNADIDRGFLWRDTSDVASDGAMSLTTDGRLYVKDIVDANSLKTRGGKVQILNSNNDGIEMESRGANGQGSSYIFFNENTDNNSYGFKLGYNGDVTGTINDWDANSFNLSVHNGTTTGDVILNIPRLAPSSGRHLVLNAEGTGTYGGEPTLKPSTSGGFGYLGTSGMPFWKMYAYSFNTASTEKTKTGIRDVKASGTLDSGRTFKEVMDDIVLRQYKLKKDIDNNGYDGTTEEIGLIVEELPVEVTNGENEAIDLYRLANILIGAYKEQQEEINELKSKLELM